MKKKLSIRKLFKKLFILIPLTCLFAFIYWFDHEDGYVYYFQQSHQTDKKGLPFVLVDHLYWEISDWYYRKGNYHYNVEVLPFIEYSHIESGITSYVYELRVTTDDTFQLVYRKGVDLAEYIYYIFNFQFELANKASRSIDVLPITNEDRIFVQEALKVTTQQLMDELNEPILNNQWLFDWTYKGHQSEKIWFVSFVSSLMTWLGFRGLKYLFRKRGK